jgi:hypothetical protein
MEKYEIRVGGRLDPHWSEWLAGFDIRNLDPEGDTTLLTGSVPDQAALYGILTRLRDLGLSLMSVIRLEDSE